MESSSLLGYVYLVPDIDECSSENNCHITRNLRQNGGRPDSIQTFRSLRMAADRYREMYGEN